MSKLFKIIIKPVIKNSKGEVFLIGIDNSDLALPNLELDFYYENINDFLFKKYKLTEDKFKIVFNKIYRRELYGEMTCCIELKLEDSGFVLDEFKNGNFYSPYLENIKIEDRTMIK